MCLLTNRAVWGALLILLPLCGCSGVSVSFPALSLGGNAGGGSANSTPSLTGGVTSPASISGLIRWYRISDLSASATDAAVSKPAAPWNDETGTFNLSSGANSAGDYQPAGANGLPSVQICGSTAGCVASGASDTLIKISASGGTYPGQAGSHTYFFVTSRGVAVGAAPAPLVWNVNGTGNTTMGNFMGWTTDTNFHYSPNGTSVASPSIDVVVPAFSSSALQLWTGMDDTTSATDQPGLSLFLNGTMVGSDANTAAGGASTKAAAFGSGSGMASMIINLSEVLMYDRALTATERCQVFQYLNSIYPSIGIVFSGC